MIVSNAKKRGPGGNAGSAAAPGGDGGERPEATAGVAADAPPSNAASANSNCGYPIFVALRWGVDSLYLSYVGRLFAHRAEELTRLKEAARSGVPGEVADAQLVLGEHIFEVRDKGTGLFPFVLEDNAYRIALASLDAGALPMAYVKVSSHRLASDSPDAVEVELRALLDQLGTVAGPARVSRIDLFIDFVAEVDIEAWGRRAWVTRARGIEGYAVDNRFSGWTIGLGGPLAARLYDKTLEIAKSGKDWLKPLWTARGWDGEARVLRLEFELKRPSLKALGVEDLGHALRSLRGIWTYCMTDWLRLTVPNPDDATRSRWPAHPLWEALTAIEWEGDPGPLSRSFTCDRAPSVQWILRQVLAFLCSLMAVRGIYDYAEGLDRLRAELESYLGERAERVFVAPWQLVRDQVALKMRRFNTGYNLDAIPDEDRLREEHDELLAQARAYRKASRGG